MRTIFMHELWKIAKQTSERSEWVSLAIFHNELFLTPTHLN